MEGKIKIGSAVVLLVILLSVGTIAYHHLENWDYIDSLYFSTITLMTIGYGDLHPTTSISKLFTVFYIIGGVSVGIIALTAIANHIYENKYPETARMIEEKVNKKIIRRRWKI